MSIQLWFLRHCTALIVTEFFIYHITFHFISHFYVKHFQCQIKKVALSWVVPPTSNPHWISLIMYIKHQTWRRKDCCLQLDNIQKNPSSKSLKLHRNNIFVLLHTLPPGSVQTERTCVLIGWDLWLCRHCRVTSRVTLGHSVRGVVCV